MIDSDKLMGREQKNSIILSEKNISNLGIVRKRLIDIDGMLKEQLVLSKVREGIRRQEEERLRRLEREKEIEDDDPDEEARAAGFKDALEWYSYSTSGHLKDPAIARHNLDKLPLPSDANEEKEEPFPLEGVDGVGHAELAAEDDIDFTSLVHEDLCILHPYLLINCL